MPNYRVLTGPTASGKTATLLSLGSSKPLLVVSADSRQVYQHMDIGTAKPSSADLEILPHYGISILKPSENFNAFLFLQITARCLREARQQDKQVWISGGTGLYIRALQEKLQLGTPPRMALRAALQTKLQVISPQQAATELELDVPDSHNPVRVVRAAELACQDAAKAVHIYRWAGLGSSVEDTADDREDMSDLAEPLSELDAWSCGGIACLELPRDQLLANIEQRTQQMFKAGLLEEVERLQQLGYSSCQVVSEGIGYREALAVIGGKLKLETAIEQTMIRTRQYAKRQRTYFIGRGWPRISAEQFSSWLQHTEDKLRSD